MRAAVGMDGRPRSPGRARFRRRFLFRLNAGRTPNPLPRHYHLQGRWRRLEHAGTSGTMIAGTLPAAAARVRGFLRLAVPHDRVAYVDALAADLAAPGVARGKSRLVAPHLE